MKTILVSVSNGLTYDQRVQKVCQTLYKKGYRIRVIGRQQKGHPRPPVDYKVELLSLFFDKGLLFYIEFNIRLFFKLLFTPKDILLANDMDTLLPNQLVSRLQSKKLIFDSHELFSEIPELVYRPFVKWIWKTLENSLIPRQQFGVTVSESIASYYKERYGVSFTTIKNYPKTPRDTERSIENPFGHIQRPIILYQGAVNVGRGLELMIDTLALLPNCVLAIIGDGDIKAQLEEKVQNQERTHQVVFLGKLAPEVLQAITPFASVGISLEEDLGLNYRYAMPNKIFDYIQAKIPIVISDLPEMKGIVNQYKVGEILSERKPKALAKCIQNAINQDYSEALQKAKEVWVWESQESQLLGLFE